MLPFFCFHLTLREFVQGKSVFLNIRAKVENLKFPDLTFCPRQERSLAYLKTKKLQEDLNLSMDGFAIYMILAKNSSILEDYSFTLEESILGNRFL